MTLRREYNIVGASHYQGQDTLHSGIDGPAVHGHGHDHDHNQDQAEAWPCHQLSVVRRQLPVVSRHERNDLGSL